MHWPCAPPPPPHTRSCSRVPSFGVTQAAAPALFVLKPSVQAHSLLSYLHCPGQCWAGQPFPSLWGVVPPHLQLPHAVQQPLCPYCRLQWAGVHGMQKIVCCLQCDSLQAEQGLHSVVIWPRSPPFAQTMSCSGVWGCCEPHSPSPPPPLCRQCTVQTRLVAVSVNFVYCHFALTSIGALQGCLFKDQYCGFSVMFWCFG